MLTAPADSADLPVKCPAYGSPVAMPTDVVPAEVVPPDAPPEPVGYELIDDAPIADDVPMAEVAWNDRTGVTSVKWKGQAVRPGQMR